MKYELVKCSGEGWSKLFDSEAELRQELLSHICRLCLSGEEVYIGIEEVIENTPPDVTSTRDLLATACGCEYEVYIWERIPPDYKLQRTSFEY